MGSSPIWVVPHTVLWPGGRSSAEAARPRLPRRVTRYPRTPPTLLAAPPAAAAAGGEDATRSQQPALPPARGPRHRLKFPQPRPPQPPPCQRGAGPSGTVALPFPVAIEPGAAAASLLPGGTLRRRSASARGPVSGGRSRREVAGAGVALAAADAWPSVWRVSVPGCREPKGTAAGSRAGAFSSRRCGRDPGAGLRAGRGGRRRVPGRVASPGGTVGPAEPLW